MKPAPFAYHAPQSLEAALEVLSDAGSETKILAGGQSLIPVMNFRLARPAALVDLNRVSELDFIESTERPRGNRVLRIGAMARQSRVEHDPAVRDMAPLLHEAMPFIAHPQIRNRGTIGGTLAHADPAAELPTVVLALDGRLRLVSGRGERWLEARDFFTGLFATALAPDEIVAAIEIPERAPATGYAFLEIARRHGDYAQVGLAASVGLARDGSCRSARLVFLSVGEGPVDAREAAGLLIGERPDAELFRTVAGHAAGREIEPLGDIHASAPFKRHLARVLTERALETAFARAGAAA